MRVLVLAHLLASVTGTYLRTQEAAAQGVLAHSSRDRPSLYVNTMPEVAAPDCSDCDHKSMQTRLTKMGQSLEGGLAAAAALKASDVMETASKDLQALHDAAKKFYSTEGRSAQLKNKIESATNSIEAMPTQIEKLKQDIKKAETKQALQKSGKEQKQADLARLAEGHQNEMKQKEAERSMRETELAAAVSDVTAKEQEAVDLSKQVEAKQNDVEAANEGLIEKSKAMLTEQSKENAEINKFEKEITDIQNKIETQETAIKKCNEQMKKILETKAETQEKKDSAKADKDEAGRRVQKNIDQLQAQAAYLDNAAADAERKQKEMKKIEANMKKKLEELAKQPNIDKNSPEYAALQKKLKETEAKSMALSQSLASLANSAKDLKTKAAGVVKNLESGMASTKGDASAAGTSRFQQLKSRHTFMVKLYEQLDSTHQVATGAFVGLGGLTWEERLNAALSGKAGVEGAGALGCDPDHLVAVLDVVASAIGKIKFEYQEVCTLIQEGQAEVNHLSGILKTKMAEQKVLTDKQTGLTKTSQELIAKMKSDDAEIQKLIKQASEEDAAWKKRIADIDAEITTLKTKIEEAQQKAGDIVKNKIEPLKTKLEQVTAEEKKVEEKLVEMEAAQDLLMNDLQRKRTKLDGVKRELLTKEKASSAKLLQLLSDFNAAFGAESNEANCDKDFVDPDDCPKFSKCNKDLGCPEGTTDAMFCEQTDGTVQPRAGLCKFAGDKCDFADKIAAKAMKELISKNNVQALLTKADQTITAVENRSDEASEVDGDIDTSGLPIVTPDKKPPSPKDKGIEVQVQNKAQKILEDSGFSASSNDDCAKLYSAMSNEEPVGENWARATIEECGSSACYPCFGESDFGKDPDQCGTKCEYKMEKVTTGSAGASMTRQNAEGRILSGDSLVKVSSTEDWTYNFQFRHRYHVDTSSDFAGELLDKYEDGGRALKDILFKPGNFGCVNDDGRTDECIIADKCEGAKKNPKDPFPPAPSDKDLVDEQNGCGAKLVPIPSWQEYEYDNPGRNKDVAAINGVQQVRLDYRPKEQKGTGLNCLKPGDKQIVVANSALIMTTLAIAAFQIAEATPDNEARFACKLVGRFQIGIENRWVNKWYADLAKCRAGYVHNEIQKIVKFASVSDYNMALADKAKQKSKIEGAFKRVCHLGTRKGTTRAKVQLICGVGVCDRETEKSS